MLSSYGYVGQFVCVNNCGETHGLINYICTEAKCLHLKKLKCKGTLRQVFIRVCRLVSQSVMLVVSTQPWEVRTVAPQPFSLVKLHPPPPSMCEQIYCLHVYCIKCVGGGGCGSGPQTDKQLPQRTLYRSIFLADDILHCLPWVLYFYESTCPKVVVITGGNLTGRQRTKETFF